MTPAETMELWRTLGTWAGFAIAFYVAWRTGKWRGADQSSGHAKALEARVSNLEQDMIAIDARQLPGRVSNLEKAVVAIETRLEDMPTRGDVEGIRSAVVAIEKSNIRTEQMVSSIHNYLLERAK